MTPGAFGQLATAIVLGTAFGVGASLLVSLAPRWGAATLASRIAPYVRDVTDPRGTTEWPSGSDFDLSTVWEAARHRFAVMLGGSEGTARRLRQARWMRDVTSFRGSQLGWAILGVLVGGAAIVFLAITGRFSGVTALLPPALGVFGAVLTDLRLTRAARARVARIEDELPTVLEFLALCLAAGEGLLDSLRRVGAVGVGDLTAELRAVVLEVGTGSTIAESLTRSAAELQSVSLSRCVDHLVAAIDRGAPLAQVLHAQAVDAREDAKRGLIEQAGRKEIYMLIPLVFLILPLSVLFAVFPGIFMLRLGVG
jgi:tight adherence protein C